MELLPPVTRFQVAHWNAARRIPFATPARQLVKGGRAATTSYIFLLRIQKFVDIYPNLGALITRIAARLAPS